jgi:hypothetical protein
MSSFGDLPAGCQAAIYSYLDPRSRARLFATDPAARRAVLECADRVSLQVFRNNYTDPSLRALGNLLGISTAACFQDLHLKMTANSGQVLRHIRNVRNLHLEVSLTGK